MIKKILVTAIILLNPIIVFSKTMPLIYNQEFLKPILWTVEIKSGDKYKKIINGNLQHPLIMANTAIKYFFIGHKNNNKQFIKKGEDILKILSDYPYKLKEKNYVIYLYNQNYGKYKAGKWWSGMANSAIGLAYLYGYKLTDKIEYKLESIKAINGTIRLVKNGGSALEITNHAKWYLEYVNNKVNIRNAQFVLNGFQFSLIILKIFEEEFKLKKYADAYQEGIDAFKKNNKYYYFPNNEWTYYKLNPLTIESTHYAIYDSMLLKSLYLYDTKNKDFLLKEYLKRIKIIKSNYNIEKNKNGDVLFSAIGAPHPYWIDIYSTELKLISTKGGIIKIYKIHPRNLNIDVFNRAFIYIKSKDLIDVKEIKIIQSNNNVTYELFKININDLPIIKDERILKNKLYARKRLFNNLHEKNNKYYMKLYSYKASKGSVRYIFNKPVDLWKYKYFYILLKNKFKINNIKIMMIDIKNNISERYYLPLSEGNNLILLSAIGFKNQKLVHKIKEFRLYIYTEKSINNQLKEIGISDIFTLSNNFQLYRLFYNNFIKNNNLFYFKEKRKK